MISANSVVVAATPRPSSSDTVSGESRRAHQRSKRPCEVMPGADDDEIPHQGEPGRGNCTSASRASGVEQPFRVFLDRSLLLRIAAAQQPEQPAVCTNARFMRVPALRRARLARA